MSATPRASTGGTFSSSSTSITTAFPSGTATGDVCYLWIAFTVNAATVGTVTCTGWTALTTNPISGTGECAVLFRRVIASGDTAPVPSFGTAGGAWAMVAVQSASQASPEEDTQETHAAASTSHIVPDATAESRTGLWLGFTASDNAGAGNTTNFTWPGGYTELEDRGSVNAASAGCAYKALSASGANGTVTATASQSVAYSTVAVIVRSLGAPPLATPRARRALYRR